MKDLRDFIKLLRDTGAAGRSSTPRSTRSSRSPRSPTAWSRPEVRRSYSPSPRATRSRCSSISSAVTKRMCLALRAGSYDELSARVERLVSLEVPSGAWEKVKALSEAQGHRRRSSRAVSRTAPARKWCMTGDAVDLGALPILQCWPLDAGRYVTLPLVFTRHPTDRQAQRRHVPPAGVRPEHHRHALAYPQGCGGALPGGR